MKLSLQLSEGMDPGQWTKVVCPYCYLEVGWLFWDPDRDTTEAWIECNVCKRWVWEEKP